MMEEFGRVDNLKPEFDRLMADPKEHRRLMNLAGPAPYKQTLASRRHAPQVRLQTPQQGLMFQQQMLLMRHRQMYQQQRQQQQRQHHPHQQEQQQRYLPQGAHHPQHHPMTSPSHAINNSPVASQVFQQQLQQCFNRLPQAQRVAIMGMQNSQRNQVLSQLLRKELQRAQQQQVQHHHHAQHHLQNVAALRGPPGSLATTLPEAIVRGPEDAAMLQQLHQRQAMVSDSRLQLGYLTSANQLGIKQEAGVGVSGRMVPQVGGMSMNMVTLQSPVRQLSSMPQRVGPPAGYLLSGGGVNSEQGNPTPTPSPSQSIPGVHANGSMPMRQAHPSQLLRIPGGNSQSLVGMLVPVSTAGAGTRTAPQSNGNGSGGGGGGQQSGHRIVNV